MTNPTQTAAFNVWKNQSQQLMDFAVLVCTACPQLEHAFHDYENDDSVFIAKNSSFPMSKDHYSSEKRALKSYKELLGANLLLSLFSQFEIYFFSAIDEIIEFHGGEDQIRSNMMRHLRKRNISEAEEMAISKLRKKYNPKQADRYRKYSSELSKSSVVWPSHRFMIYGLSQLIEKRKNSKPFDIPNIMRDFLTMDISEEEVSMFHNYRNIRNKVAHGKNLKYDLRKSVSVGHFLLQVGKKVNGHIKENFLIIERFVR